MLSEATLNELKQIMHEEYARELSREEVAVLAQSLVGYYDLLANINSRFTAENNEQTTK